MTAATGKFLAALLALAAASAAAQVPRQLPAVVIKADPGPGILTGTIRDDLGFPIEGVEVFIPSAQRRVHSDSAGVFRLDEIRAGKYDLWMRKIGYVPHIQRVAVAAAGTSVNFVMPRSPRALPAVVSAAAIGGLSGIVADTALRRVPGAHVHIQGEGQSIDTDSSGEFYVPLEPGDYFVAISKSGFYDRMVSVNIPADSGRAITAFLQPSPGPISKWILIDMSHRLAWRSSFTSRIFTHRDLEQNKIEWIYDAVHMATAQFGAKEAPDPHCDVIVDGRGYVELASLTIDAIDCVEVYAGGGACPRIYVWTR